MALTGKVCLLLPILLWGGCHGEQATPSTPGKVLLIGLDGAEWDLIRPMAAAGELPNLKRIMETGAQGNLRSLEPPAVSPTIWTTIATGKSPSEHGIGAFVGGEQNQPMTSNTRAVRAIWNIASMAGRTTGVVGWLVSWPAEKVNGFVVSAYVQYGGTAKEEKEGRTGWTYPAELADEIVPLVVNPEAVPWSFVERFLDAPIDKTARGGDLERPLTQIERAGAADLSFTRIAEKLYRERRPDFFAVYLRGMDSMGHTFWNTMRPEATPSDRLDPGGLTYFKGTMRAYYRFTDELIGRIVKLADDRTTIVVVSDHGFKGGPGGGVELHKLDGVIMMTGHNVRRGQITGASVYDVTPTLLVLLGLRPAKDMRGKVIWSALDPAIPRDRFTPVIGTYEPKNRGAPGAPLRSPADDELTEQLRALGYLE